ncbi:hypothetical protein HDU93_008944 [Gonapodya sp. JEL0774]|nr:hypothetical protein HDU93_008944 [Gonapodya sp. JEL0774]
MRRRCDFDASLMEYLEPGPVGMVGHEDLFPEEKSEVDVAICPTVLEEAIDDHSCAVGSALRPSSLRKMAAPTSPPLQYVRERDRIVTEEITAKILADPKKMVSLVYSPRLGTSDLRVVNQERRFSSLQPKAVYFIIPNEFAERFCYYGITPILKNYLYRLIGMSSTSAKSWVHTFKVLTYFFPLLGSMISDSFLGKYHTIVYLSFVYVAGVGLLAISSIPSVVNGWLPILALVLVALGTGGIKPCVSSHGVSINIGGLISGFATPAISQQVVFGLRTEDGKLLPSGDGYAWAFGLCALVMAFALGVFIFGFRYYRVVPPTRTFILWDLLKIAGTAMTRYFSASKEERASKRHWAAFADDYMGASMADETYDIFAVLPVLIPIPFFWMAFDQNGTSWQDQGAMMKKAGFFNDEIASAVINPFWIVVLVPIFSNFLYPFIEKATGRPFGLMMRMTIGMLNLLYNEVGTRTKASGSALWLLTVSFGNLLATALFEACRPGEKDDFGAPTGWTYPNFFWLNTALLVAFGFAQLVLARFYVYRADRPWIKAALAAELESEKLMDAKVVDDAIANV